MKSVFVRDVEGLVAVSEDWDRLAVASGRPAASPSWMLGWLKHIRPDVDVASVLLYEDDVLVGIAPFVYDGLGGRNDARLMAAGFLQRIAPLTRPGTEHVLGSAIAAHLAGSMPRPDVVALEGVPVSAGWTATIHRGLRDHGLARRHLISTQPAPVVTLAGHSFDSWMATRTANFRSEMRRCRKRLERHGGRVRLVTGSSEDVAEVVRALGALHQARWASVGQPGVIDPAVERLILDVARTDPEGARLRLWVVDVRDVTVSAQVFLAAGGEVSYWNGGWSDTHADVKPGLMGILAAIEDATERRERRLDLGGGAQPYKLRFADGDDPLEWSVVAPLRARYPRTRLELLRQQSLGHARRYFHRLPPTVQGHIRKVRG